MTLKQDRARYFNSIMPKLNHEWASRALDISVNTGKGPDLINDKKFVELKFATFPNAKDYVKWTVLEYQLAYQEQNPDKTGFWGLGIYSIIQLPSTIRKAVLKNNKKLEGLIGDREIFILDWDWMNQFPPYHNRGQTEFSQWDHKLRHPKKNKLPKVIQTFQVEGGIVHLTQESQMQYFPHLIQ